MINSELYSIIFPGRIVEYFPSTQLSRVKICAERPFNTVDELGGTLDRTILEDVPVHTPSGGGWALTMPIKPGDTCLLFFSQIGYDHWLYKDKDTAGKIANLPNPLLRRKFSEDDGFALVGINTIPRAVQSYSSTNCQLRNSDATQIINLKDDLSIEIDSTKSVSITAPTVTIVASTAINLNGKTTITGDLTVTGDASIKTKDFISHTHTGATSGTPTSGVN